MSEETKVEARVEWSATRGSIAEALSAAQARMVGAKKDAQNPHLKNSYASLGSVIDEVREPLTSVGIAFLQFPVAGPAPSTVSVVTELVHKSGEWCRCTTTLPVGKADAQGHGSAITYARRYGLMGVTGLAPVDDDGEEVVAKTSAPKPSVSKPKPPAPAEDKGFGPSDGEARGADQVRFEQSEALRVELVEALLNAKGKEDFARVSSRAVEARKTEKLTEAHYKNVQDHFKTQVEAFKKAQSVQGAA